MGHRQGNPWRKCLVMFKYLHAPQPTEKARKLELTFIESIGLIPIQVLNLKSVT
jgi:hypothetical protein